MTNTGRTTLRNKTPNLSIIVLMALVAVYAVVAHQRNRVWKDPYTLWYNVAARSAMKPRPYTYLGLTYATEGRLKEANENFLKATSLGYGTIETSCNMGHLYADMKEYKKSIIEYSNCLKLNPNSFADHLGLADALAESGDLSRAVGYLTALAANPAFRRNDLQSQIYFKLGNGYASLDRLGEAESFFDKSIKLNPENPYAINALGNVYLMEGRLIDAAKMYVKAVELKPDEPEPLYNAAITFERLGKKDMAMEFYNRFIALNPEGYEGVLAEARAKAGTRR